MKKNVKNEIMKQIKDEKIRMTDRWIFVAKKIGLQSGLALLFILLILFFNAFFYYIKSNGLLISWHYGPYIWQEALHSIPYDLMIIIIFFFLLMNFIGRKFDYYHKKNFVFIFGLLLGMIVFFSMFLFATNFNDMLKTKFDNGEINAPYIGDFYKNRCGCGMSTCQFMNFE